MPDAFFFDEQLFLAQAQQTTEPDAATQPDFDLATEGQVDTPGQGLCPELTPGEPKGMTVMGRTAFKVEFALGIHSTILGKATSGVKFSVESYRLLGFLGDVCGKAP